PMSAGNVSKVPPPAIEFTAPPTTAATRTSVRRSGSRPTVGGAMGRRRKHARGSAEMPFPSAVRYLSPHVNRAKRPLEESAGMTNTQTVGAPAATDALEIRDTRTGKAYTAPITDGGGAAGAPRPPKV